MPSSIARTDFESPQTPKEKEGDSGLSPAKGKTPQRQEVESGDKVYEKKTFGVEELSVCWREESKLYSKLAPVYEFDC